MKNLLFLLALLCTNVVSAQKISRIITLPDGREVDNGHVFVAGEDATFHSENGQTTEWEFRSYSLNKDTLELVLKSEKTASSFTISTAPELFRELSHTAKRFVSDGDSSVYYKGFVYQVLQGERTDSMAVTFNLLPSRPKLVRASLYGNYDWTTDNYDGNAILDVTFTAARMDTCQLMWASTDQCFLYEFPCDGNYIWCYCGLDSLKREGKQATITITSAEWGQYYCVAVYNQYGGSLGDDRILSSDYISDPAVRERIAQMKKRAGIAAVVSDPVRVLYQDNVLYVCNSDGRDGRLTVYTLSGLAVKCQESLADMDLSDCTLGIYIVKVEYGQNESFTTKIIKR